MYPFRLFQLATSVGIYSQIRPDDVVYITLPLYHTNGGILGLGQMLFQGSTVVLRRKFSASNFWPDCVKYKCTVSYIGGGLHMNGLSFSISKKFTNSSYGPVKKK